MGLFKKKPNITASVTFSGPSEKELKKQAAQYYAANKNKMKKAREAAKAELQTPEGRDKRWKEYTEESKEHLDEKNYGYYRCTRYDMAMLLKKEGKNILPLLTEVIFWDLTGCGNSFDYSTFLPITMGFLFPYEKSIMKIAPGVIREVGIFQKKAGLTDEQLRAEMLNNMQNMTAPVQFFTYAEIVDIFFWERDKNTAQLKKVYAKAKKRFNPKHPNIIK